MRGLKPDRSARVVIAGHAFVQNFTAGTTSWPSKSRSTGGWRLWRAQTDQCNTAPHGFIRDRSSGS
jgi:hypothetical protein